MNSLGWREAGVPLLQPQLEYFIPFYPLPLRPNQRAQERATS